MPNIEYFDYKDFRTSYRQRLAEFHKNMIATENEIRELVMEIANDGTEYGTHAGRFVTDVGGGAAAGFLAGSAVPGVGNIVGGIVGGSIGFVSWVSSLFASGEEEDIRQAKALLGYQKVLKQSRVAYAQFSKRIEFTDERFQNILNVHRSKASLYKTRSEKAKAALSAQLQNEKLTYERQLTKLNVQTNQAVVGRANTIDAYKRRRDIAFLKHDALIAKADIQRTAIDTQLNVVTSKYKIANLAKNMQALKTAELKQRRFIKSLTPAKTALNSKIRSIEANSVTLKGISEAISAANAIEQSEMSTLINYKKAMTSVRNDITLLSSKRTGLAKALKVDLAELSATTSNLLAELDGQRKSYDIQIAGLAQQRKTLVDTNSQRRYSFDARLKLLDDELADTLNLLDIESSEELTNQVNKFNNLMDSFSLYQIDAFDTVGSIDLGVVSGDLQSSLNSLQQAYNNLNTLANEYYKYERRTSIAPAKIPTLKG